MDGQPFQFICNIRACQQFDKCKEITLSKTNPSDYLSAMLFLVSLVMSGAAGHG